jgi:D-glucosaminate-6-phosphate ammonia-lyase
MERRVNVMRTAVSSVAGVTSEEFTPKIANQVPHLRLNWNTSKIHLTSAQFMQELRDGEPSIELVPEPESGMAEVASWMLQPGEAEIVGRRMKQILGGTRA